MFRFVFVIFIFVSAITKINLVSSAAIVDPGNGITLAFAIDNTASMSDDISGVIKVLNTIMEHIKDRKQKPIVDFVLTLFNDPDPPIIYKTTDKDDFQKRLNAITVYGGGDCPELAMSGIKAAIMECLNNSIIYAFTDASAKDRYLGEHVIQLAKQKNIEITFLLTGECSGRNDENLLIYDQVASETLGKVYHVADKKQVGQVLKYIAESLNDRSKLIGSGKTKIEDKNKVTGRYEKEMFVDVDDTMQSFTVILNGNDPKMIIKNPKNGSDFHLQTKVGLSELLIQQVNNPAPGRWTIKSSSTNSHTIEIKTTSGIDFLYGFSLTPVGTLDKTIKTPIQKTKSYATFRSITDDFTNPWNPHKIQFIDTNGNKIGKLIKLKPIKNSENLFRSSRFSVPDQLFYISVIGYDALGNIIKRISKYPIEPQTLNNKTIIRDGKWSEWSDWTKCSVHCGTGIQFRYRECNNPTPLNGGNYCEGTFINRRPCNEHPCPINGGWSEWKNWTKCSASCGKGLKTGYRTCTNPVPVNGGKPCIGDNFTTEVCELKVCDPDQIILRLAGFINGKRLKEQIVQVKLTDDSKGNQTTSQIIIEEILQNPLMWSPIYHHIMSSIALLFSKELENSTNGFTLSRGNFHQISKINFHSGESLKIRHYGHGMNDNRTLIIDIQLNGELPEYSRKLKMAIPSNEKILMHTEPGKIYIKQYLNVTDRKNKIEIGYDLVEIFEYSDKSKFMAFIRQNLNVNGIRMEYSTNPKFLTVSIDSSMSPASIQECPSGFILDGGKYCSDLDECGLNTHSCSHNCKNLLGTYQCYCPEGMELLGVNTCHEIEVFPLYEYEASEYSEPKTDAK